MSHYKQQEPRIIVESTMAALQVVSAALREAEKHGSYTPDDTDFLLIERIEQASHAARLLMLYMGHTLQSNYSHTRLYAAYRIRGILSLLSIPAALLLGIMMGWVVWGKGF